MVWLFVFGLIAYVVYLDRRLARIERGLVDAPLYEMPEADSRPAAQITDSADVEAVEPLAAEPAESIEPAFSHHGPWTEPAEPQAVDADQHEAQSRLLDFD